MKSLVTLLSYFIISCHASQQVSYKNSTVWRIIPKTDKHLQALQKLQNRLEYEGNSDEPDIEFWKYPGIIRGEFDLFVPSEKINNVKSLLQSADIEFETLIEDVGDAIENEQPKRLTRAIGGIYGKQYLRYDAIVQRMLELTERYPDLVKTELIGHSVEGRQILLVRLSNFGGHKVSVEKKVIFIDAGIHAREWISVAVALHIIESAIEAHNKSRFLDFVEFFIVPVANPDGYEYSHQVNRMWRKNRAMRNGSRCVGVDLNRNFNHKWMVSGSSMNPCAHTYAGPYSFSEPEAAALATYITNIPKIDVYLTLHSYGQVWLFPWGFSSESAPDVRKLQQLVYPAVRLMNRIGGQQYSLGQAGRYFPPASGASDDWAYHLPQVAYSYTVELRDRGRFGFILPPEQIEISGMKVWEAVKCILKRLYNNLNTCVR